MHFARFLTIKGAYDQLYTSMLARGKLPLKDTGVGYWSMAVADDIYTLFQRIKLQDSKNFIDIGSGDGKVVMIASLFTKASGIEIDSELHEKALKVRDKLGLKAKLVKGDYHDLDLSKYDVIFYHPDHANHKLELKLMDELKGKLILYGPDNHPTSFQREMSFIANSTPVSIFVPRRFE